MQAVILAALFNTTVKLVGLSPTLKGAKPIYQLKASVDVLDDEIRRSAWLKKIFGGEVRGWSSLKTFVGKHWDEVVKAAERRLKDVVPLEEVRKAVEEAGKNLDVDKVARELVGPALLLLSAERLGEKTLLYIGMLTAAAIQGDGGVDTAGRTIYLTTGRNKAAAYLWVAVWAVAGVKPKLYEGEADIRVSAYGDEAVKLAALYGPYVDGDERLNNYKFVKTMELAAPAVRRGDLRLTEKGTPTAHIYISAGGVEITYKLYLYNEVKLAFKTRDEQKTELGARLLRLVGVKAEAKKHADGMWQVHAYTDGLASASEALRKAVMEVVKEALERGFVDKDKAEHWLKKLQKGVETWNDKRFYVGPKKGGLVVSFESTSPTSINDVVKGFKAIGLEEGNTSP